MQFSILKRLLIGNTLVILVGAIGGTLLTRHLALVGDIDLILIFFFLGVLISILVNYWIIKTVLRPLDELRSKLEGVKEGQTAIQESQQMQSDPDIHRLVLATNSMLQRLAQRTRQLHALSERAINAQEEERVRIARCLHDDTSQAISMLIINLEQLKNCFRPNESTAERRLAEALQLASNLHEEVRKIIWNLRPTILDDLGLVPAIRWYTRSVLTPIGIEVDFENPGENTRFDPLIETTLFRVIQETINNIQKHAEARKVTIHLVMLENMVHLDIVDDGKGFDVDRASEQAVSLKTLGLLGIQERVSLVDGEAIIKSNPGQGTHIKICVPFLGEFSDQEGQIEKVNTPIPQAVS